MLLNYIELYGEPIANPFGTLALEQAECLRAVYKMWRATSSRCKVEVLHKNVPADFTRTIGGIGVLVPDGDLASSILQILHAVRSYAGVRSQLTLPPLCTPKCTIIRIVIVY
jgi:hypothetical protein